MFKGYVRFGEGIILLEPYASLMRMAAFGPMHGAAPR